MCVAWMTMMERLRMVLSSEVTSVTSTVQTLVLDLSDLMVVRGY